MKENAFLCSIDKKQFIMLTTVEYISLLREYMRKNSAKYGISRMGIFGSVARGEQREGSVSIFVLKLKDLLSLL